MRLCAFLKKQFFISMIDDLSGLRLTIIMSELTLNSRTSVSSDMKGMKEGL